MGRCLMAGLKICDAGQPTSVLILYLSQRFQSSYHLLVEAERKTSGQDSEYVLDFRPAIHLGSSVFISTQHTASVLNGRP